MPLSKSKKCIFSYLQNLSIQFFERKKEKQTLIPTNFHLTKACNYKCIYCYATFEDIKEKGLSFEEQKKLISLLADYKAFRKINFAEDETILVPHIKACEKVGF
ncbi:MAG: hypothetical protein NZ853_00545 [Leptospiraceae bacterium]|nr:hypothetical protein [Leptospiraceae bacterium]MDW7976284.1 hypothetical protein [Leptospiraceae bacterium]